MPNIYLRTPYAWPGIQLKDPTAAGGTVTISLIGNIASMEAFGNQEIAIGLILDGLANSDTYGSPAFSLDLFPSALESQWAFGSPYLSTTEPGIYLTYVGGITSEETFGSSVLVLRLDANGIPTGQAFGIDSITLGLALSSIASMEGIGSASIQPLLTVLAGIPSGEMFGDQTWWQSVSPTGIASMLAFGLPGFAFDTVLSSISTEEAFGLNGWILSGAIHPGKARMTTAGTTITRLETTAGVVSATGVRPLSRPSSENKTGGGARVIFRMED